MYKKVILSALMMVMLVVIGNAFESSPVVHQAINSQVTQDPVILDDDADDAIYYDSSPAGYYTGLTSAGTMFAARFTPEQTCSLSSVEIVSYYSSGSATIHIMSSSGGAPNEDLIDPFTATLSGDLSYQSIDLPSNVDVGSDDFFIVVEYSQTPPPYVTVDGDGNTDNRSLVQEPNDDTWYVLDGDLNYRAWIIYYGEDLVAPKVKHGHQVLGYGDDSEHVITTKITDWTGVDSAELYYSLDGSTWNEVTLTNTSGDFYEGSIPYQSVGTTLYYYLHAVDASSYSHETYVPSNAPIDSYPMTIVEGSGIEYDDGTAEKWWIASSSYENNAFAIRMTPSAYPATVLMTTAYVSVDSTFNFTINAVSGGQPGDVLDGGGPVEGCMGDYGWAISEFSDGPTIESGHFFLLFNWRSSCPGYPAVGQDTDNTYYRSYWYTDTYGWNQDTGGEYMMRTVVSTPVGIEELDGSGNSRPASYELIGNYPNPFNPTTDIKFLAPEAGNVRIDIYNVNGQLVKTVINEYVDAGIKTVTWDGTNDNGIQVNSGVYFYKLSAGDVVQTEKMVLMK